MKLISRLFTSRKMVLGAVSLVSLGGFATAAPYADANPFERSAFGDDWGILSNDIFGGADAIFGLSPASRTLLLFATSKSKTSENAIVNAASSEEDLFLFASPFGSAFARSSGGGIFAPDAITASGSWNVNASGNWSNSANWLDGIIADGAGDSGNFTFNITATTTVTIDTTPRTLGIMNIGDSTGDPSNYTIAASGGGTLTFDNLGSNAQLNQTSTSGNNTISAPILLNDSLDITNASANILTLSTGGITAATAGTKTLTTSSGAVTISGVIGNGAGIVAVTHSGPGTLTLSGNNTYSGGTTVSAGLLQLNSSSALGSSSGSLTVNGGILDLNGQNISVGNLTGSGGTIWNNGPNSGSSTVALTIGNGNTGGGTYAGVIQDNNGASAGKVAVTKTGTGTITLSGANTYTGITTVTSTSGAGKLFINGDSSAATGAVNVNSGGTTLGGSGITGGAVTVASGSNLSPGPTGIGSTADLRTGALTLNSGSFFNVDLNGTTVATGYDQVTSSGAINFDGSTLVVMASNSLSVNDKFFILSNSSAALNGVGAFTNGLTVTANNGYIFTINYLDSYPADGTAGNDISLTLTAVPEPSTWIGAALALAAIGFTQRRRFAKRSRVVG